MVTPILAETLMPRVTEFENLDDLNAHLRQGGQLVHCALQSLDLTGHHRELSEHSLEGCLFLGCRIPEDLLPRMHRAGALVFPKLPHAPFTVYRAELYTADELILDDYVVGNADSYPSTLDGRIWDYYVRTGRSDPPDIRDSLARRLHDHAMTDVLREFVEPHKPVAVMGGHGLERGDPFYRLVAEISRRLTRDGYLLVSGGGPGAMEATNLGAWFAERAPGELAEAIERLSAAPLYSPIGPWMDSAAELRRLYPRSEEDIAARPNLAIPTWHYGHEPANVFATHIAKYFANSVREEGLLALAKYGVVFSPGSAGTIQEIFQDAAQNHYQSFGGPSPMLFLGSQYWTETKPVYPLLQKLAEGKPYHQWLRLADDADELVRIIHHFTREHPDL